MSELVDQVLKELRLPPKLASMVAGDTEAEVTESARKLADELRIEPAPAEHVLLARQALKHAEAIRQLHGSDPEPVEVDEDTGPPDFDGGAREPAPVPSDPEADFNETMVELAREARSGRGGAW